MDPFSCQPWPLLMFRCPTSDLKTNEPPLSLAFIGHTAYIRFEASVRRAGLSWPLLCPGTVPHKTQGTHYVLKEQINEAGKEGQWVMEMQSQSSLLLFPPPPGKGAILSHQLRISSTIALSLTTGPCCLQWELCENRSQDCIGHAVSPALQDG